MKRADQEFLKRMNTLHQTTYKATLKFDMDDVLALFGKDWIAVYNEIYEDTLTTDNMTEWNTSLVVKPECGSKVYDHLKTPGLFRYVKPNPHAQDVIKRLIEKEFDIVIVSDSPRGHSHCERERDPSFTFTTEKAWFFKAEMNREFCLLFLLVSA
ncbi:hypothetical protein IMZ31_19605 (plasmid) [Pontibacillus sp. ALD_SL1]|uniref:5' nucleotidase, NT5C type n=1 Tax=Pontibacillus sp. ALD_SL1 TaxID=2777185 RepID=UPI001A97A079|nr:hypothetical protein [Pontibacillus sp. ALD_SL1]QST02758.1 hypothetical protein IMZ31_19605 [Pontibacillus sp. ALD_SL1]